MAIAVARLDTELKAVARELEAEGPGGRALGARLSELLDRSLGPHLGARPPAPPADLDETRLTTWHGIVATHRRTSGVEG
jgi:hypothetical protein